MRRAYHRANNVTTEKLRAIGITPVQAAAVMSLHRRGPSSQAELGRSIGMEPGNVHGLIARLTKLGVLATQAHPSDARQRLVVLTAHGTERAAEIAHLTAESSLATLAPLAPRERDMFLALLRRVAHGDDEA